MWSDDLAALGVEGHLTKRNSKKPTSVEAVFGWRLGVNAGSLGIKVLQSHKRLPRDVSPPIRETELKVACFVAPYPSDPDLDQRE